MIFQHWLDWRVINLFIPFLGILSCAYLLISSKTCTRRKGVSTALSIAIVAWLMLVWADWGSAVYQASYQSMANRVLMLIVSLFIMAELRHITGAKKRIGIRYKKLFSDNALLRRQLLQQPKKKRAKYYEPKENCYYKRTKGSRYCHKKQHHR